MSEQESWTCAKCGAVWGSDMLSDVMKFEYCGKCGAKRPEAKTYDALRSAMSALLSDAVSAYHAGEFDNDYLSRASEVTAEKARELLGKEAAELRAELAEKTCEMGSFHELRSYLEQSGFAQPGANVGDRALRVLRNVRGELERVRASTAECNDALERVRVERETQRSRAESTREAVEAIRVQRDQATGELQAITETLGTVNSSRPTSVEVKRAIDTLQAELEDTKEALSLARQAQKDLEDLKESQRKRLDKKELGEDELLAIIANEGVCPGPHMTVAEGAGQVIREMRTEIAELKRKLGAVQSEAAKWKKKFAELEKARDAIMGDLDVMQIRVEKRQAEINELKHKLADCEATLSLRRKYDETVAKCEPAKPSEDYLDEIVAKRTQSNPQFPAMVDEAAKAAKPSGLPAVGSDVEIWVGAATFSGWQRDKVVATRESPEGYKLEHHDVLVSKMGFLELIAEQKDPQKATVCTTRRWRRVQPAAQPTPGERQAQSDVAAMESQAPEMLARVRAGIVHPDLLPLAEEARKRERYQQPKCDHPQDARAGGCDASGRVIEEMCVKCGEMQRHPVKAGGDLGRGPAKAGDENTVAPPPSDLAAFEGPAASVVREPAAAKPGVWLKRLEALVHRSGASINAGQALEAARADVEELLAKPLVQDAAGSAKDGPRMERLEDVLIDGAIDYAEATVQSVREKEGW